MARRLAVVLVLAIAAADCAAQGRSIRLFLSPVGLSNPADTHSPAVDPSATLGVNPALTAPLNHPVRLYLWAKFEPAGTPNNVTYNGISVRTEVTGVGGALTGFSFWNYTNGLYGNGAGRWQQFSQTGDALSTTYSGAAVVAGAGVNNTAAAIASDTQHRRFAADGTTRIDSTLLGWMEFAGSAPALLRVFLSVGPLGISQSGQPVQRVYLGWGDEDLIYVQGGSIGMRTPIPEATILVPEPCAIILLAVAAGVLRRR